MSALLAFVSCVAGTVALAHLGRDLAPAALARVARSVRVVASAVDALLRLGREGREPGALERRRLLVCGAAGAFGCGVLLSGPLAGALLALGAPTAVSRALRARRAAYRRAVDRAAPAIARALADALAGGHSLRGAVTEAAAGLGGAGGAELRRVAREMAAGQRTEAALDRLRLRCAAASIDSLVAAVLVHRRSGGDLAGLLWGLARGFEDQQRLVDEARVATAQARFTGVLVVVLPLGGAALAELARPGFLAGMVTSPLTAWLVAVALALQVMAAVLIRRLGRVPS